ncbi:hypothetical protein BO71DRAFT_66352 [Aspergillus ellipticus CBS 707.79]|uniref:Uncharacterized protein n=1 Tax=Aspergillus ellipticus CBS 707.79 TaxID=1448320 RepID=A0A319D016_9EURO|nr:hypothetical protein BO71DRAFT_66352 [Aspergillus ellipticus CBS 707.79]
MNPASPPRQPDQAYPPPSQNPTNQRPHHRSTSYHTPRALGGWLLVVVRGMLVVGAYVSIYLSIYTIYVCMYPGMWVWV